MDGGNNSTAVASGVALPTPSGNRCGHDPEAPRFFAPPPKHANRPGILRKLTERIQQYYARPASILPGLNAANESERQQRSERREACCAILAALIHYTDLITLRVGIPQADGSMQGLTMEYLARISGLAHLDPATGEVVCMRRAERAVHDLKAAGIITVHSICEKIEEGVYKGTAAIRTVSKHLFSALGLGPWLEHERRRAKERKEARDRKRQRKQLAQVHMAVAALDADRPAPAEAEPATPARTGSKSAAEHLANIRANLSGKRPTSDPP